MKVRICLFFLVISLFSNLYARVDSEKIYPVVILGGGIGGLTSGLYLTKGGISPLIVEGKEPGGMVARVVVNNWPGEEKISGFDLIHKIKGQVEKGGAIFLPNEVIDVDFTKRPFIITTRGVVEKDKVTKIKADCCIVAMGTTFRHLDVEGEDKYEGRGVSSCAVCDGMLYKDQQVAVIGGGDSAICEALYLSNFTKKVYVIVRQKSFSSKVEKRKRENLLSRDNVDIIYNCKVEEIKGNKEQVTCLILKDVVSGEKREVNIGGVFLAIGAVPNTYLFERQLKLDDKGYIVLREGQQTSIKGIYAVGDIVNINYKKAILAAGQGARAALQVLDACPPIKHKGLVEITSRMAFEKALREAKVPVLVDFYATWCAPCKKVAPLLEKGARELQGKVKILKVDIDKNRELAKKYNILSMPTMIVFDGKEEILRKIGSGEIARLIYSLEEGNYKQLQREKKG